VGGSKNPRLLILSHSSDLKVALPREANEGTTVLFVRSGNAVETATIRFNFGATEEDENGGASVWRDAKHDARGAYSPLFMGVNEIRLADSELRDLEIAVNLED